MTVELVFDSSCPHIEATRKNLRQALSLVRLPNQWTEWERSSSSAPRHVKRFGSPTVLVNGTDVAGELGSDSANCCRLYRTTGGRPTGVPSVALIQSALIAAAKRSRNGWTGSFAMAPAVLVSFLPKLACPMCWPAYAGLLTSLGLGFLISEQYLFWFTAFFLLLSVGALVYGNRRRRGPLPAILGSVGASMALAGKFGLESMTAMYLGLGLLIAASFWNSWPRRSAEPCPQCAPGGNGLVQLSAKGE